MKTIAFSGTKVLSLDEITFTGRNKTYGAYYLRRKYHSSLLISFLIATGLFLSVWVLIYIYNHKDHPGDIQTTVEVILPPSSRVIKPKLPPIPPLKSMLSVLAFKVPNVVDTTKENQAFLTNDDLFSYFEKNPFDPSQEDQGKAQKVSIIANTDLAYISVTEPAVFQDRNYKSFREWVMRNINYTDEMREMHLEGRQIIQFIVEKDGSVNDVCVLRGVDPLMDNASVKTIGKSPRWTPAKLNGRVVRQKYVIPIVFKIQDQ